ncbi:MAG: hypothetical protein AB1641_28565 [Thermodesulfobacteriota bacterium]
MTARNGDKSCVGLLMILAYTCLTVLLLVNGCRGGMPGQAIRENDLTEPYESVLDRWTREARVYQDLESKLLIAATYKSLDFRRAYVRKYSRVYGLAPGEEEVMLAEQTALAEKNMEFLLAVSGPTQKETDLDTRDSAWRIYLEGDIQDRIEPFEVYKVKKRTARLEGFFPFISPWDQVYQVRFIPRSAVPRAGRLNLVLTGVLGTARLVYHLEDASSSK